MRKRIKIDDQEAADAAAAWVAKHLRPARRINKTRGCYSLKHGCERATGHYIDLPTFVGLLRDAGYTVTDDELAPNANVLESSARAALRAAGILTFGGYVRHG